MGLVTLSELSLPYTQSSSYRILEPNHFPPLWVRHQPCQGVFLPESGEGLLEGLQRNTGCSEFQEWEETSIN